MFNIISCANSSIVTVQYIYHESKLIALKNSLDRSSLRRELVIADFDDDATERQHSFARPRCLAYIAANIAEHIVCYLTVS